MAPLIRESALTVPLEQLRWRCDPDTLGFTNTSEVRPLEGTVGQERGVEAVALGLALDTSGFHIYVAGSPGSGRTSTVRALVTREARHESAASDWCYLHNFAKPAEPIVLQLPPGRGPALATDLDDLIANARREIPRLFEGDQYQQRRADITRRLTAERTAALDEVTTFAEHLGFAVEFSPNGVITVPLLEPGKPMSEEAFRLLPDARQAELGASMQEITRRTEEADAEAGSGGRGCGWTLSRLGRA